MTFCDNTKYKEGNNRLSSDCQISLVYNHDKAGNKCYTQDNTNNRKTQVCEQVPRKNKTSPGVVTHPPWNQEYNGKWQIVGKGAIMY